MQVRFLRTTLTIVALCALCICAPFSSAQGSISQEMVEEIVQNAIRHDAALVVQITFADDVWTFTGGSAIRDVAVGTEDRFRIGSVSKTFVAALTLKLAEEGVLNPDDLASDYLPEDIIDNVANAEEVTIRDLLAMRSGVPDYLETDEFWDALAEDLAYEWTAEDALTYIYGEPAMFAPDEEYYYSNSNYLLIQVVLESATGESIADLMREYILDPLNLTNTYTQIAEILPGGTVESYTDFDGDGTPEEVSQLNDGAGLADGGLVSTVGDVSAFYTALLRKGSFLEQESLVEMLDFQDDGEGGLYGLGISSWETFASNYVIGHTGSVVGFTSLAVLHRDSGVIIVILSADDELDLEGMLDSILIALFG